MPRSSVAEPLERRWPLAVRVVVALGWLAAASLVVAWAPQVPLLVFAGVLLGLLLHAAARWLSRTSGLPYGWSLALTTTSIVAATALVGWLLAPSIEAQLQRFAEEVPRAWQYLRRQVEAHAWLRRLAQPLRDGTGMQAAVTKGAQSLSLTLTAAVNAVIVLFLGLYFAAEPRRYADGLARLVPAAGRERAREVIGRCASTLERWLIGRGLLMLSNGVATAIGLWLLGVPLPFVLGLVAGVLNFVPNFGPVIAAIPAVLLAFPQGVGQALAVAAFYFVYQMLDGFVLTPLVQRKTVALPPALTITAQVLMGMLFGTLGVLLAVPAAAVALVVLKTVYLQDVLADGGGEVGAEG